VINMKNTIDNFRGEYYFLSNYYIAEIEYRGIRYPHNESAFQAQKIRDNNIRKIFAKLEPTEAKKLGKKIQLRHDWNHVKDRKMYEICYEKFKQNKDLRKKLLDTGDAILIEGNTWHDTYWGMCNGKGKNKLGKILMNVRDELNYY
jgi:ribA/ribD-fused uncharacterized protein